MFGNEVWAIRLPALVAGIALVPATFAFARVLYGRAAGLLAAAFVAASSTLVEYSTNARGYTLVALATVLVFIAAARALEQRLGRRLGRGRGRRRARPVRRADHDLPARRRAPLDSRVGYPGPASDHS